MNALHRSRSTKSTPTAVLFGVPQGLDLGPILFLLKTADLLGLIDTWVTATSLS